MSNRASPPHAFSSKGLEKSLIRLGVAPAKILEELRASSDDRKIIAAIAASGRASEDEILSALAQDIGVDRAELKSVKVLEKIRKSALLGAVDSRFLIEHRCVPIERLGPFVLVAMADPLDIETLAELEFALGAKVKVALAREEEILASLQRLLGLHDATEVESTFDAAELNVQGAPDGQTLSDEAGSETAPVIRFVNQILADAHAAHASDVHLEPGAGSLEVRYRIDGVMTPQLSIPKRLQSYVIARVKILSGMDITEKRRPQDGRFRARMSGNESIDIRSSTVPTQFGEKIVLRLLRSDVKELSLAALRLPEAVRSALNDVLKARDRIVLVCGPTGSGKTTSLYSAINDLQQGNTNIITVEDPVEIRLQGVTQIQVDSKIGMTFASGLRSILRQDPDIILVGEIRDLETAETAFQAAQTGHLVLSTLHTNTAVSAVVRLLDLGLEPFVIASSLGAVLAQRLVRTICPQCSAPATDEKTILSAKRVGLSPAGLRRGRGCEQCENAGYRGRVGVYSLLVVDGSVREMIRQRASEAEILRSAREIGMQDLFSSALDLVRDGLTTLEEVERVIGLGELIDARRAPENESSPRNTARPAERTAATPENREKATIEQLADEYHRKAAASDAAPRSRILLIDDDEGVRAVMSRVLQKAEFDVCEAANGYEALDKLSTFWPDIIVSDLVMPGLSGRDLVEELKRDERTSQIPILMLTGSDNEENEIELLSLGANDFVSKASSPTLVITRIKRLLGNMRMSTP